MMWIGKIMNNYADSNYKYQNKNIISEIKALLKIALNNIL